MLVLTRQRHQSVMIGSDIEMKVVDLRGDKVRLGFIAPDSVTIHRKEIFAEIALENQSAANIRPADVAAKTLVEIEPFLRSAIEQAKVSSQEGGFPIGAVLVRGGLIIAAGRDRRLQQGNHIVRAEIDCLTSAGRQKTFADTVLYTTHMSCYLCAGAMIQLGLPRVIVGGGKSLDLLRISGIDVIDLHDQQCADLLAAFMREHPGIVDDLW